MARETECTLDDVGRSASPLQALEELRREGKTHFFDSDVPCPMCISYPNCVKWW